MKLLGAIILRLLLLLIVGGVIYYLVLGVLSEALPGFMKWSAHLIGWQRFALFIAVGFAGQFLYEEFRPSDGEDKEFS